MKKILLALVTIATFALAITSAYATPAWEFQTAGNSYSNGNWDFGTNFNVTSAITVTGLGYYADPNTGFVDQSQVALYKADGTLLASATVDNTYALYDHFRYVTINPIILEIGSYQIDGLSHGNNYTWNDPGFYTNSSIQYVTNLWTLNAGSASFQTFASADGGSDVGDGYWGPNFFIGEPVFTDAPVPEPSTMLLLGGGIAGLAFWRRKKKV